MRSRAAKPIYLRTARLGRGLTQVQLAAVSGVQQTVISYLETHPEHGRVTHQTMVRLADALDVPLDRLRLGPDPADGRRDARRKVAGAA